MKVVELISREKTAFLLVGLITLSIILLLYNPWNVQTSSDSNTSWGKALTKLFVKTAIVANKTRKNITYTFYQLPYKELIDVNELEKLLNEYRNFTQQITINPFLHQPSQLSALEQKLFDAYNNYYLLANASHHLYLSSILLDKLLPSIEKSLNLLSQCKVDEALIVYKANRKELVKLKENLVSAHTYLSLVDEKKLLSKNHREIYEKTKNITEKIYKAIDTYIELFETVDANPDIYKSLCYYGLNGSGELGEDEKNLAMLLKRLLDKTSDFGDASNSMENLKVLINNVYDEIMANTASTMSVPATGTMTTGKSGGSGAGYHSLTETD